MKDNAILAEDDQATTAYCSSDAALLLLNNGASCECFGSRGAVSPTQADEAAAAGAVAAFVIGLLFCCCCCACGVYCFLCKKNKDENKFYLQMSSSVYQEMSPDCFKLTIEKSKHLPVEQMKQQLKQFESPFTTKFLDSQQIFQLVNRPYI